MFNKPAEELFIDLLNHSNGSYLSYGSVVPFNVETLNLNDPTYGLNGVVPPAGMQGVNEYSSFNTKVSVKLKADDEVGIVMYYRRLDLGVFFASHMPIELFVDEDEDQQKYHDAIIEQVRTTCLIQLTPGRNTFVFYEDMGNGSRICEIIPWPDNLVWTGTLTVLLSPTDHLSADIRNTELSGLTLSDMTE